MASNQPEKKIYKELSQILEKGTLWVYITDINNYDII